MARHFAGMEFSNGRSRDKQPRKGGPGGSAQGPESNQHGSLYFSDLQNQATRVTKVEIAGWEKVNIKDLIDNLFKGYYDVIHHQTGRHGVGYVTKEQARRNFKEMYVPTKLLHKKELPALFAELQKVSLTTN